MHLKLLVPKGRILAVSFHSLEDRIVKVFHENSNLREIQIDTYHHHLIVPKLKIISKNQFCQLRQVKS